MSELVNRYAVQMLEKTRREKETIYKIWHIKLVLGLKTFKLLMNKITFIWYGKMQNISTSGVVCVLLNVSMKRYILFISVAATEQVNPWMNQNKANMP